jgi:transposase
LREGSRWTEPAVLVELSVMEQRYQAVLEVLSSLLPVAEVAERYGVSRQTLYAWSASATS